MIMIISLASLPSPSSLADPITVSVEVVWVTVISNIRGSSWSKALEFVMRVKFMEERAVSNK